MAEILIKDMDMLPEGCAYDVRIRGNGDVVDRVTGRVMGHAIEVPTHGRLIDLDAFLESEKGKVTVVHRSVGTTICRDIYDRISNAQIVIEAST